ncbi:MAG TPA: sulfatase-like hydrolase/transferase [bacterium]|nr:sulfatase-like hydrolase/transferase [bacterium]
MPDSRPNILWICSDQQRWDTLGCYGNPLVASPTLDRLAETGVIFDRAFSQSPVCTPSRTAFLTGRYPRTARGNRNGADIPDYEVLVTRMLADAGYRCGLSGKLHLSACHPSACPEMERRIDDGYTDFHWSHHSMGGWGLNNEYWRWLDEHGSRYQTPEHPQCKYIMTGMPQELHQTTWCVEKAMDFIMARHRDGQPWLFSVNMFDPHHPFDPPESFLNRYLERLDEIPLPNYVEEELANKPVYQKVDHEGAYANKGQFAYDEMTEKDHRMVRAAYWAMCDLIDTQVGRLLALLEETGQSDNTVVIFTSDHGEMLGDHGIYLKGPHFYDCAIRIPLILSWKKKFPARHASALVELVDLPQTLLDCVGLPKHPGMQGKSLYPLLCGETGADRHRDDIYCEYYQAMPGHQRPSANLTMVRTAAHKLVVDHSHGGGELYDLAADPNETRNLWDNSDLASVKSELLLRMCHRMADTVDPLPQRRAGF